MTNENIEVLQVIEKVYKEYGNDGFVPDLADKVADTLFDAFRKCANMCQEGGDETFSYTYLVVTANKIKKVRRELGVKQ